MYEPDEKGLNQVIAFFCLTVLVAISVITIAVIALFYGISYLIS